MKKAPLLRALACACALASLGATAFAQAFPSKPITVIAPFASGGSADGIARLVAKELQQTLGQPVVVDNRPGAGGATGLLMVSRAAADGYTIGIGATGAIAIGPQLPDAPPLNPQKQLQPLGKLADIPLVVATHSKNGFDSLSTLIRQARLGEVPLGNSGQFTAHHLAAELLASTTQARLTAVPYRGSAPAVNDVLGGQLQVAIVDLTSAAPHIKAGTLKGLAVTSEKRSKLAPDVPTVAEAGVPGYAAPAWMGLFAPKGLPADVSQRFDKELRAILAKPDVQAQILNLAAEPAYLSGPDFEAFINVESKRWAAAIAGLPKPKE